MKFIETYDGKWVNFDDISYLDNDYDEDKEYCISYIHLKNGEKIQFIDEIAQFNIPGRKEVFRMQDAEMSILHRCFLMHVSWCSKEFLQFYEEFPRYWRDFEIAFEQTIPDYLK